MRSWQRSFLCTALLLLCGLPAAAVVGKKPPVRKPAAPKPAAPSRVDFARDIQPLFKAHCIQCHGGKQEQKDTGDQETVVHKTLLKPCPPWYSSLTSDCSRSAKYS